MQVILLDKVQNLGDLGEIVNVKNGYARNYLIPQKKASRATEENIKAFEAQKAELVAKAKESLAAAQARAESVNGLSFTISANASPMSATSVTRKSPVLASRNARPTGPRPVIAAV